MKNHQKDQGPEAKQINNRGNLVSEPERRLYDRFGPGKKVRGLLLPLEIGRYQPSFAEIGPHGRPLSTVEVC